MSPRCCESCAGFSNTSLRRSRWSSPCTHERGNESRAEGLLNAAEREGRLFLPEPLGYVTFMNLVFNARLVITDSGGIQEETSYLGIPCLTLRKNTERPVTVTHGTNRLCEPAALASTVRAILSNGTPAVPTIEFWDGRTADRVVAAIGQKCGGSPS